MTCLASNDLEITAYVLTNTNSNLGSLLSFIRSRNSFLRSSLSKKFVCFVVLDYILSSAHVPETNSQQLTLVASLDGDSRHLNF